MQSGSYKSLKVMVKVLLITMHERLGSVLVLHLLIGFSLMAIILFKLRFVPDDEAEDIREILDENAIDYYETSAGILGFSMPALWLKDESQLDKARQLIDDYQQQRQIRSQQEYTKQKQEGTARSFIDIFKESPLRYMGYLLTIALIVYFTVILFIRLGK